MQPKKRVTLNGENLHPKKYFTAQDLKPGKDYLLTIRFVRKEEMFNPTANKKETKPVIYFNEAKTATVLGTEFSETIATALNEWEADQWIGKKIVIFRTVVRKDKNGEKEGIRAKSSNSESNVESHVDTEDETTEYAGLEQEPEK